MRIKLIDRFKSLHPFESEELSVLTVITGYNGSGKSQFLDLIHKTHINDSSTATIRIEINPPVNNIQYEGIIKESLKAISHDDWKVTVNNFRTIFNELDADSRNLIRWIINNGMQHEALKSRTTLLSNEPEYKELLKITLSKFIGKPIAQVSDGDIGWINERSVLRNIFKPNTDKLFGFVDELCRTLHKTESELLDADFYNTPIPEFLIDESSLFSSQIELIFYNYAKRRDANRLNWFYKNEDGDDSDSISDSNFIEKYPPPWDIINSILDYHKVDFIFKGVDKKGFTTDTPISFQILKKSTREIIPFMDLSSGEKVIIGLVLKLFTSEYYADTLKLPELLLLDEPDAHLHPEMSNLLLDVLEDTFAERLGIRVIMTTHSPSTIALANEECIYKIANGEETSLKKITKDDALQILTSFIPTLSIDYKNHKQIFVESPTDRYYYQTIFDKLNQDHRYPFKLYFISNGYGKGNSNQVIEVIDAIRKSDNKSFYGVIDWDSKNTDSAFVKVHGAESRYSIENYVYDPLYLIVLLLEMNAHNIHKELNIDISFNQYNIINDQGLIQKAIDWFFRLFYTQYPTYEPKKKSLRIVKYHSGLEFNLPTWYLEHQGHDLEVKLKSAFKALEKYRNEGELQEKLTIICAKCYPMIPEDTHVLIRKIIDNA